MPIRVPPLRERPGDIPDLIDFFLGKINSEMGTEISAISSEARERLVRHGWPGNVRELENTLIRSAVLAAGPTLMPQDLTLATEPAGGGIKSDAGLDDVVRHELEEMLRHTGISGDGNLYAIVLERFERPLIELTLEKTGGNQLQAAALLGINRNTLRKKISALGIEPRRSGTEPADT